MYPDEATTTSLLLAPPPLASVVPAAAMVYTDLPTLRGLSSPADYGSGVEYADGLLDQLFAAQRGGVGLQIGLWLGGSAGCRRINSGRWDDRIQNLVDYLSGCSAPKIFLRIGYEFDNPSFGYSDAPEQYVKAYRKLVNAIRRSPAKSKVLSVWHSWAAPKVHPLEAFWPGDAYVDWVGVSVFQQLYPWANANVNSSEWAGGTRADVEEVLRFAAAHGRKPTMIAESTPFGGIDHLRGTVPSSNSNGTARGATTTGPSQSDPWERWYGPILELIDRYDVGMWSYIDCDWDALPMWRGVGFGESRVASDAAVMEKWRRVVVNGGRRGRGRNFLMAGSMRHCGRGGGTTSSSSESLLGLPNAVEGEAFPSSMEGTGSSVVPLLFGVVIGFIFASLLSSTRSDGNKCFGGTPSSRDGTDEATEVTPILLSPS